MEYRKKVFKGKQKKIPNNIGLNLYELNKMAYSKMPVLEEDSEEWNTAIARVEGFVQQRTDAYYFMLLNNEMHYYTIFHIKPSGDVEESVADIFIECIKNIGQLIAVEMEPENALECWIKCEDGIHMFLFFSYDQGVIECHQ